MKKYLIGLFAVVFAVGAVAFTTPALKKTTTAFHYVSGDQKLPGSYQEGSISCSGLPQVVCTIQADEDQNSLPIFTSGTNPVDNPTTYSTVKRAN